MLTTSTKIWHTQYEGYQARVKGIPRESNWYEKIRPATTDSEEWLVGWDRADKHLGVK